jgi:hypothetical protein
MTTCWYGPSSPFELQLQKALPFYAIEQLRLRLFYAVTTSHDPVTGARVILQMAYDTEISTILVKQIQTPAQFQDSVICERRHYIDVDNDMQLQSFLIGPAMSDLEAIPNMPRPYVEFLTLYLTSPYPRYRVSALANVICVAEALQQ